MLIVAPFRFVVLTFAWSNYNSPKIMASRDEQCLAAETNKTQNDRSGWVPVETIFTSRKVAWFAPGLQ